LEKSDVILSLLDQTKGDWEETAYRWLFNAFGFKINSQPMLELANRVPCKLLLKHRNQPSVLEAMLFGQAGLLPEFSEEPYVQFLIREYDFYRKKYGWSDSMKRQHWTFMSVRPSNFPTLRIAQLVTILAQAPSLLRAVMEDSRDFSSFRKLLQVNPTDYWKHHYNFGKSSEKTSSKGVSSPVLQLLVINYVVPLWFAYGRFFHQLEWQERCFDLLQELPEESNFIIRKFAEVGWRAENGFDSQGMIGQFKNYCQPKKCLQCKVAQNLIKTESKAAVG
jgi:hypothetical protein